MNAEEFKEVLTFWANANKAIGAYEVAYYVKHQQIPPDMQFLDTRRSLSNQVIDMSRRKLKDYTESWDSLLAGYDSFKNIGEIAPQIKNPFKKVS